MIYFVTQETEHEHEWVHDLFRYDQLASWFQIHVLFAQDPTYDEMMSGWLTLVWKHVRFQAWPSTYISVDFLKSPRHDDFAKTASAPVALSTLNINRWVISYSLFFLRHLGVNLFFGDTLHVSLLCYVPQAPKFKFKQRTWFLVINALASYQHYSSFVYPCIDSSNTWVIHIQESVILGPDRCNNGHSDNLVS